MAKSIPTSLKLDDKSNLKRTREFAAALDKGKCSPPDVLRALVDAFNRYVKEHGGVPSFPVEITITRKH